MEEEIAKEGEKITEDNVEFTENELAIMEGSDPDDVQNIPLDSAELPADANVVVAVLTHTAL